MHRWCFSKNKRTRRPMKSVLVTCFMITCILAWLGIANLQATEKNVDDEAETTDISFQNHAQAQRAKNIATQVALHDPKDRTIDEITREIHDMRTAGMGWGEIAKYYDLHPSILGLGHSKPKYEPPAKISKPLHWKTEFQEATARGFKGGIADGHGFSGSKSGQKDLGQKHSKVYRKNQGKGLALGHNKDKSEHRGGGRGNGYSGGHGNGRGGGHGRGKK